MFVLAKTAHEARNGAVERAVADYTVGLMTFKQALVGCIIQRIAAQQAVRTEFEQIAELNARNLIFWNPGILFSVALVFILR